MNFKSVEKLAHINASPLCPYDSINKKFFDFSKLEPLGRNFIEAVANTFILHCCTASKSGTQNSFSIILNFFWWLVENQTTFPHLTKALKENFKKASAAVWEEALTAWHEKISNSQIQGPSKKNTIQRVHTFFRKLVVKGFVPNDLFLKSIPNEFRYGRPTRCLAEAVERETTSLQAAIINEHVRNEYGENSSGTANRNASRRDFLTVLLQEKGTIAGSADEHAKILLQINSKRLWDLRECAEGDFNKWFKHWQKGQELIKTADLSFEEMDSMLKLRNGKKLFPTKKADLSIARLLKLINDHPVYKGILHNASWMEKDSIIAYQVSRFGGSDTVQAYLSPHLEMTVATIVIFLCDTGANVSVAQSLSYDCLADSSDLNLKVITGTKMRAGGKLIVEELPIKDKRSELSCVKALEMYRTVSQSLRDLAPLNIVNNLFLRVGGKGEITTIFEVLWSNIFKKFTLRHPKLANLKITSEMIRPSVLMQTAHTENLGIIAAQLKGDHNSFGVV